MVSSEPAPESSSTPAENDPQPPPARPCRSTPQPRTLKPYQTVTTSLILSLTPVIHLYSMMKPRQTQKKTISGGSRQNSISSVHSHKGPKNTMRCVKRLRGISTVL